jgi:cell division protein ZapA
VERESPKGPPATEVEIFGAIYNVRGRDDRGYLQELASHVDRTMREVAERVSTVDAAKIAILAALNIADDLFRSRRQLEGERAEIKEKAGALAGELSAALDVEPSPARRAAHR